MSATTLVLPWTGSAQGWEVLAGTASFGLLPRLFAFTALGFGAFPPDLSVSAPRR